MAPTRPRLLFALSYRLVRFRPVMRFTQNHKAFVRETQLSELSFARELRLAVDQPGDDRKQKAHRDTAHQDADDALKGR
jgi:hypothetical protein